MRDITIHAIATQEKILLFVEKPMVKNAIPRMRKIMDMLFLLSLIVRFPFELDYRFDLISGYGD